MRRKDARGIELVMSRKVGTHARPGLCEPKLTRDVRLGGFLGIRLTSRVGGVQPQDDPAQGSWWRA
jgi:hypothetical protein